MAYRALREVHGVKISHVTVASYAKTTAIHIILLLFYRIVVRPPVFTGFNTADDTGA